MKQLTTTLAFITLAFSTSSFAISDAAKQLQRQWDIAKYQTTDKKREEAFEKLAKQAKEAEQKSPDNAEVLVWEAIILSTYAGEKGGFGALGLVKEAKSLLEKAEQIDANVLNGSAYTSLGTLYYQVPGWPIAARIRTRLSAKTPASKGVISVPACCNHFLDGFDDLAVAQWASRLYQ